MDSRKMVLMNLFSGQQWRNRHREQTYGHGGRGGEGKTYGQSNKETYITMSKIDSNRNLLYDSGTSNRGTVTVWKVGWGERWERGLGGKGHECTYG